MRTTKILVLVTLVSFASLSYGGIHLRFDGANYDFDTYSPGEVKLTWAAGNNVEHNSGGAFLVTSKAGGTGWGPFDTFCTEWSTANLYLNTWYWASVDNVIVEGDAQQQPTPITNGAAWIYTQFRANGYTFAGSTWTNRQISEAIWNLLGWSGGPNLLAQWVKDKFPNWWAGTDAIGNVRAMNLWTKGEAVPDMPGWYYANDIQSQLTLIPAPAAAMLGVIGLGLVGWVKRRLS